MLYDVFNVKMIMLLYLCYMKLCWKIINISVILSYIEPIINDSRELVTFLFVHPKHISVHKLIYVFNVFEK